MKWLYLLMAFFLLSCKDNHQNETSKGSQTALLRIKPVPGQSYSYTLTNESQMQQEVDEKDIDNETNLEIGVTYRFTKDSASGFILDMHYDQFKLYVKALDQEKELDAATASFSFDPSDKMFAAFHNASIQAYVDSLGNVFSISGIEVIKNKMRDFAGSDLDAQQMLNGSIRQYISNEFFKQSVEGSLRILTARELEVGDTIQSSTIVGGELNIGASATYKLKSLKNGIATIEMNGAIDITEQQLQVENTRVTATIKGQQTGESKINLQTGMPESVESTTTLKGTMRVLGRVVPFTMKTINKINLRK